jgi:hypothetical protein
MLDALRQRTVAKVLFDEHHGEAWSIRPEAAARMRPSHPAAASYAAAAAELTARDFTVATSTARPLDEVAHLLRAGLIGFQRHGRARSQPRIEQPAQRAKA